MADYFTHFSCLLDVGTPENAARALDLYNALADDTAAEDPPSDGFVLSIQPEHGGTIPSMSSSSSNAAPPSLV